MRKTKIQKLNEARIQRAVSGFGIPMLSIPALYKQLEQAVESDWSDEELKQVVREFPGVEEM